MLSDMGSFSLVKPSEEGQICWGGYTLREKFGYTPRGGLGAGTGPKLDQNGPKKNKKKRTRQHLWNARETRVAVQAHFCVTKKGRRDG